jgi:hypothetical protein
MTDSPSVVDPDAWIACEHPHRSLDDHVMWHSIPICVACRNRARREYHASNDPDLREWLADVGWPWVPSDRGVPTYRPRFR